MSNTYRIHNPYDSKQRQQQYRERADLLGSTSSSLINRSHETHLDLSGHEAEDHELMVHGKLRHSHNALDDLIAQGVGVRESLRSQYDSLKGIKGKVYDVGQTLGLSTTTLRMIERRLKEDWMIFVVLAILFLVFMYCFYRYWRL